MSGPDSDGPNTDREAVAGDPRPSDPAPGRRRFLGSGGVGALVLTLAPPAGLLTIPDAAVAQAFTGLGGATGRTLLQMARDIYPHDRLPDQHYLNVLAPYDAKAAATPDFKALIVQGVHALDTRSLERFKKRYAQIALESDRTSLLYEIEETRFFQTVRIDLIQKLYNDRSLWPRFGYEGSSWEKGGYLNRGFDDINWL
jgi:hypothetical protein